jgi:hypothetical protein
VQGGKTFIDNDNNVGWWERIVIEKSSDDILFNIPLGFKGRPDLISHYFYGKASLFWLVMQYNNIIDPELELVEGKELRLPSTDRVMVSILNKATSGVRVKK